MYCLCTVWFVGSAYFYYRHDCSFVTTMPVILMQNHLLSGYLLMVRYGPLLKLLCSPLSSCPLVEVIGFFCFTNISIGVLYYIPQAYIKASFLVWFSYILETFPICFILYIVSSGGFTFNSIHMVALLSYLLFHIH